MYTLAMIIVGMYLFKAIFGNPTESTNHNGLCSEDRELFDAWEQGKRARLAKANWLAEQKAKKEASQ